MQTALLGIWIPVEAGLTKAMLLTKIVFMLTEELLRLAALDVVNADITIEKIATRWNR